MESRSQQNKISQGTTLTGDINAQGGFRIEGTIEGNINTPGKVVIGATGVLNGSLSCANADIEGKVTGKIMITGTLTLRGSAQIEGEVVTKKLAVEPGATFNASCTMGTTANKEHLSIPKELDISGKTTQNAPFERSRRSKAPSEQAN